MRFVYTLILATLAGCGTIPDPPLLGVPLPDPAPAETRILAQADSVLALPPEAVTMAGLAVVQRAQDIRLHRVESRSSTADNRSRSVVTYLVFSALAGAVAFFAVTSKD